MSETTIYTIILVFAVGYIGFAVGVLLVKLFAPGKPKPVAQVATSRAAPVAAAAAQPQTAAAARREPAPSGTAAPARAAATPRAAAPAKPAAPAAPAPAAAAAPAAAQPRRAAEPAKPAAAEDTGEPVPMPLMTRGPAAHLSPEQTAADEGTESQEATRAAKPAAKTGGKAASATTRRSTTTRGRKPASAAGSQAKTGRGAGAARRTAQKGASAPARRGTSGSGAAKSRAAGTRTTGAKSASAKAERTAAAPKGAARATGDQRSSSPTKARKPRFLKAARKAGADDLKRIKGVGPKLETTLNELGIFHYDQIAKWTPEHVMWVDDHLKFKGRIARDGWVDQSQILASGGETEFSKRSDKASAKS